MNLVRVFVATTEGPSEIQQIIKEDPEVRSVICLNGTSEALPVSRDYDSFVRKPTGVVERLLGHTSFRVDVSHSISNGQSWQLGLLAAHAVHAQERLAEHGDEADEVLWATGEVRHNLDVAKVDHIREKILKSEQLFLESIRNGRMLTLLVSDGNLEEIKAEFGKLGITGQGISIRGLQSWSDFDVTPVPRARRLPLWAAGLLLVVGLAGAAIF
ncbi:MAG: hypothetical protein Q8O19_03855, partial [Rectinemataceae bacterium]|nr:hypothetical protein [Rectinemataceae bacterium]